MTDTFTWTPDYGVIRTRYPRAREAKFGDGYAQRIGDGLNTDLSMWKLNFSSRTAAEIKAIDAFLRDKAGVTAFYGGFDDDQYFEITKEVFGQGDGSRTEWQLARNGTQYIYEYTSTPLIYIYDWQGDRLMYSTPRTNMLGYSTTFESGFVTENMILSDTETDPAGGTNAIRLESYDSGASFTQNTGSLSGDLCNSVWMKRVTGSGYIYLLRPNGVSEEVILTTSWQRFSVTSAKGVSDNVWGIIIDNSGDAINIAFGQCEAGTTPTSYIPTTNYVPVVTDYVLSSTGLVTFAVPPVLNADLEVTLSCMHKFICKSWSVSYPQYGIQSLSAEFEEVIE